MAGPFYGQLAKVYQGSDMTPALCRSKAIAAGASAYILYVGSQVSQPLPKQAPPPLPS